jgi:hypothetical protein
MTRLPRAKRTWYGLERLPEEEHVWTLYMLIQVFKERERIRRNRKRLELTKVAAHALSELHDDLMRSRDKPLPLSNGCPSEKNSSSH